jgi:cytoskeletal protein CcmA (bactofilin family)
MTSRIERGMTIEGSIRGEGELEVAGRLRGALTIVGKLIVEQGGIVEADVEATDIEVAGLLAGSATAHNTVQVIAGGRVEARIKAPRLMVDDGALFRGELMAQGRDGTGSIGFGAPEPARAELPAPAAPRAAATPPKAPPAQTVAPVAQTAPPEPRRERSRDRSIPPREEAPLPSSPPAPREHAREHTGPARRPFAPPPPASAVSPRGDGPRSDGPRSASASVRPGQSPTTTPRRDPSGPVMMPMLPRGRTKVRTRGGDA